jgi:uncharacterized protein DUF4247
VSRHAIIALALSGVGVLGLVFTLTGHRSVRDHIQDRYRYVRTQDGTRVYTSSKPVSQTVSDIADARKPADRRAADAGVFLRYDKDIVSVVPDARGRSRVLVDDENSGYRHNYGYLGGFWGTYSGPAESFRGGGPGSGK